MRAPEAFVARRSLAGFTLLEILIVIVIVGVIISMVTIAVGVLGRDREMQDQAERLNAVLIQAKEECELQGFDVGLRISDEHYDFLRFDNRVRQWLPIEDDDFFAARQLPAGLKFRLWLEGREVILKPSAVALDAAPQTSKQSNKNSVADNAKDTSKNSSKDDLSDSKEKSTELPPQILVLSSGDVNTFKLQFDRDGSGAHWQIFSKPDSTVVLEQADDAI